MSDDNNPFNIVGDTNIPELLGKPVEYSGNSTDVKQQIESLIASSDIFLFMKGNAAYPQCGFSANVVAMLNHYGKPFKTFDILSDPNIRQGVKDFANWPTFPQLYIKGEMVGGNDILMELHENGELENMLS